MATGTSPVRDGRMGLVACSKFSSVPEGTRHVPKHFPSVETLVITHIFFAAASRLLLWLQKPRKYRESAMLQADRNSLRNSGKPWLTTAFDSPHFVCLSSNCTITTCSISLTQRSPQKMWVMTRCVEALGYGLSAFGLERHKPARHHPPGFSLLVMAGRLFF